MLTSVGSVEEELLRIVSIIFGLGLEKFRWMWLLEDVGLIFESIVEQ